jgi:hypothetical protein
MSNPIDRAALSGMTDDEIDAALREGRLDALIGATGGTSRKPGLHPAEVQAAIDSGTLDEYLTVHGSAVGDSDQGARGGPPGTTRDRLRDMSADEIAAGLARGDFDALLSGSA